jgi:hypothetical protein
MSISLLAAAPTPCFIMFHLQFADSYTAKTVGYIHSTVRNYYASYDRIYFRYTLQCMFSTQNYWVLCILSRPYCIILMHTKYFICSCTCFQGRFPFFKTVNCNKYFCIYCFRQLINIVVYIQPNEKHCSIQSSSI